MQHFRYRQRPGTQRHQLRRALQRYRYTMATADDLPRDWWTTTDIAAYLGVKPATVRRYLAIGLLPDPDRSIPGRNFWKPRTITKWHASRPRKGQATE